VTRALSVAAMCVLLLTACTSTAHHSSTQRPVRSGPGLAKLVATADLQPCPRSVSTRASAGLPDVTLPCLGRGPAVHLGGLVGAPTVVNIWASWCGPCQKETTYLAQAYDALRGRVRFLGVDDEDESDSALDFAAHVRPRMRYPSVVDANKQLLLGIHNGGVPVTLYVNRQGKLVHTHLGPYLSVAALRADISHYLGVST
jgi:cytochrome c biogenesis protein CcmG/thiol:disulfide interchange protein DsbE